MATNIPNRPAIQPGKVTPKIAGAPSTLQRFVVSGDVTHRSAFGGRVSVGPGNPNLQYQFSRRVNGPYYP